MIGIVAGLGSAYHDAFVETGKEAELFFLVTFLLTFGFIRLSTHMIRAQVSWWPGNVAVGGTHVHHLVFGIITCLIVGYVGIAIEPDTPWREILAVLFGIGAALTLDEFALWLNLQDVYWSAKGRQSIDAVVVTTCLLLITLLGLQFWIDVHEAVMVLLGIGGERLDGSETTLFLLPWQLFGVAFGIVCMLKGKLLMGIVGVFVPLVGLVGAVRPAKPGSRWQRWRAHSAARAEVSSKRG